MTAPSAEVLVIVDSLAKEGLILFHLAGLHDVEKKRGTDEKECAFLPCIEKGVSDGAGEEQIVMHRINHLGDRGRRYIHLHENLIHAVSLGARQARTDT
jgi:hypothetical protein